jgi:endonuclease/exonuclease/phosphatase family metal-dependent hydrolase
MTKTGVILRVMTWNIHGAFGRNVRYDTSKVVELVNEAKADIVALQEVDSRRGEDCFSILKEKLGSHGVEARSVCTQDGDYGQILISRWPLTQTQTFDISFGEFEPRRAIKAHVAGPFGTLAVVATHLGLSIKERRDQARALLRIVADPHPVILLGDFNDWFWPGSVRSVLRQVLPGRSRHRTFPSWCPMFRFDRIYCRPAPMLRHAWTNTAARHVSDHLPVIGEIEVPAPVP